MHTILGGGLAGLAAAVSLASRGARAVVLEQSTQLGGRARTTGINGFRMNLGPHAVFRNGYLHRMLMKWGISLGGSRPTVGAQSYFVLEGRKHPMFRGPASILLSNMLSPREKVDALQALHKLRSAQPPDHISLRQWINQEVHGEKSRLIIEALARVSTYCADAARTQAGAALRQIQAGMSDGVLYLDGGWQTMVEALEQKAISLGVHIERGVRVSEAPQGAILAVGPREVQSLTGARLPALRPLRMACLDLGLAELPSDAAHFALGLDRPYYFSVHSQWARLARSPRAVVHVAKYLSEESAVATRAELEGFADLLMPGWRDRVVVDRFLPEMTVSHMGPWVDMRRPAVDEVPGVLVAGDWAGGSGEMLSDAAVASAVEAATAAWRRQEERKAA